ncbi:hypothetical protein BJK41_03875 [Escherichia coli]|nr:hypothetical protein BJK41_03875 [Escherichia coli]
MSHTGRMPEVKNRMFTLHPLFTTYHYEIKGENRKVNSVNSSFEKKFFFLYDIASIQVKMRFHFTLTYSHWYTIRYTHKN